MRWKILALATLGLLNQVVLAGQKTYTVKSGDSVWSIARKFDTHVKTLSALNPKAKWGHLKLGLKIAVPGDGKQLASRTSSSKKSSRAARSRSSSSTYVVRRNDNDWVIAHRFGTTPKAIRQMNPAVNWRRLKPGTKLAVPGGSFDHVAATSLSHSRYAVVAGDNVIVRSKPTTGSRRINQVDSGVRVTLLDHQDSWYRVRFAGGSRGWVRGDLLKATRGPRRHESRTASRARSRHEPKLVAVRTGSALIDRAYSYRNVRYHYGGTSRHGIDCSGFTSSVYRGLGVKLPRTSHEQFGVGARVSRGALKAGDLVFFKTNRGDRVNHVGMYVGNGKFIHASSGRGRVTISSLSEGYYSRRYAGARRVVKSGKKS